MAINRYIRSVHCRALLLQPSEPTAGPQDYGGNTLLVPPEQPEAVACILYLSDVRDAGAATAVVPHSPHLWNVPGLSSKWVGHDRFTQPQNRYSLPRGAGEPGELYAKEQLVRYSVGTALLYRERTRFLRTSFAQPAVHLRPL